MMIDDDDVEAEPLRFRQRLDAGGAAIDGDQQRRAALGERADRLDIRAVAFEHAVGNVDDRLDAARGAGSAPAAPPRSRHRHRSRRRSRCVSPRVDGVGDARRRRLHVGEHVGIGHQPLDGRIEKGLDLIDLDTAAGEDARQQLRQLMALRDRQRARRAALVEPVAPGAAGRRVLDAEEEAILHRHCTRHSGAVVSASPESIVTD